MFARRSAELYSIIGAQSVAPGSNLEIEVRFGSYDKGTFRSAVKWRQFTDLHDYLRERSGDPVVTVVNQQISGNTRKIITNESSPRFETKTRVSNPIDIFEYGLRIGISMETDLPVGPENFSPQVIREKNVSSYLIQDGKVRVDMSEVTSDTGTIYEVEVEMLSGTLEDLQDSAEYVFKGLHNTLKVYTLQEKSQMYMLTNRLLSNGRVSDTADLNTRPLVKARNLKKADLIIGGIVGGSVTYAASLKADGLRKLLIIDELGIWLVYSNQEANLIERREPGVRVPAFIFDGELIPMKSRKSTAPQTLYWYLIFDTLVANGSTEIQSSPYDMRMKLGKEVSALFESNPIIRLTSKMYMVVDSPQSFFDVNFQLLVEQSSRAEYFQDGIIYTPMNRPPLPTPGPRPPVKDRILSKEADVVKWKPPTRLTIDFMIRWKAGPDGKTVELLQAERGVPSVFKGSTFYPIRDPKVEINDLIRNVSKDTVVEFAWLEDRFVPQTIRHDKAYGNDIEVVHNIWDDINDPIVEETLRGSNLDLVYKQHNNIKKQLFERLKPGSSLLDIGSGRGGDVRKWYKCSKIVAVEPSKENISELNRRLESSNMTHKTKVVNTWGQDFETITKAVKEYIGGPVDAISLMLSMTFFWSDSKTLDALIQTIVRNLKAGGQLIFLTMDGDAVKQAFVPNLGGYVSKVMELAGATLYYDPEIEPDLTIDIPGSIVGIGQRENLVMIDDFRLRLESFGFVEVSKQRADMDSGLLSKGQKVFTSLYTYGEYQRSPKSRSLNDSAMNVESFKGPPISKPEPQWVTDYRNSRRDLKGGTPAESEGLPLILPETLTDPSLLSSACCPTGVTDTLELTNVTNTVSNVTMVVTDIPSNINMSGEDLPGLVVKEPKNPKTSLGPGDDVHVPLTCSWFGNLVRIANMGYGDCFVHSVSKGFYRPYQDSTSFEYREKFAEDFRHDMAVALTTSPDESLEYIVWQTAVESAFPRLLMEQLLSAGPVETFGNRDYSLKGLQALFESKTDLGDEVYRLVSDIINVDIVVLRLKKHDCFLHLSTIRRDSSRGVVIVGGNGSHYETIGFIDQESEPKLIQTYFQPDHPFILAIKRLPGSIDDTPQVTNVIESVSDNLASTFEVQTTAITSESSDSASRVPDVSFPISILSFGERMGYDDPFMLLFNQVMFTAFTKDGKIIVPDSMEQLYDRANNDIRLAIESTDSSDSSKLRAATKWPRLQIAFAKLYGDVILNYLKDQRNA